MEILLSIGAFLLYAVLKILATLSYAVVCGCGLAIGFKIIKTLDKKRNKAYLKSLEEETVGASA